MRKQVKPLVPAEHVREGRAGRQTWYYGPAVLEAIRRQERERVIEASGGDPDLVGSSDSPQLERLRAAKATLAEFEVAKQRGLLIDRRDVQAGLATIARLMRSAGEILIRTYGNDAGAILEEALSEAETRIRGQFGGADDDSPDGTESEAGA